MIEFNPQPLYKLSQRVPKALEKIWDAEDILVDPDNADRPGLHEEYIFDFISGCRLIISREKYRAYATLRIHISASFMPECLDLARWKDLGGELYHLVDIIKDHLKDIGLRGDMTFIGVSPKQVIHCFIDLFH